MTRILLVEDNPILLESITRELELRGYTVQQAQSGTDLFKALYAAEALPDMVVTDINMPDMDEATLRKQLQDNPAWCNIDFLFLVAFNMCDAIELKTPRHAKDYLVKPFSTNALVEAIQYKLNGHERRVNGK